MINNQPRVEIVGVHRVEGDVDVYLIEIKFGNLDEWDWGDLTQYDENLPRAGWQAPYDERQLESNGDSRYAFFFHFLDFDKPLLTSFGPVELPVPTPLPSYLSHIEYEEP